MACKNVRQQPGAVDLLLYYSAKLTQVESYSTIMLGKVVMLRQSVFHKVAAQRVDQSCQ